MFVQTPRRAASPEAEIAANNARFSAALERGDAAEMADCYTPDARLLPPGYPAVDGREGICAFWSAGIAGGLRSVALETQSLEVTGGRAVEVGRATVALRPDDGPESLDVGKYVVVHERRDGAWRWLLDIFNSDGSGDV